MCVGIALCVALVGCHQRTTGPIALPGDPSPAPGYANGFYRFDATGKFLGPPDVQISSARLRATNNGNTRFELDVRYPPVGTPGKDLFFLVLDGISYPALGWGTVRDGQGKVTANCLSASDLPATACATVSAVFGCKPELRRHPDYRLDSAFTAEKPVFTVGEPMLVRVVITNCGDQPFRFTRSTPPQVQCEFAVLHGPAAPASSLYFPDITYGYECTIGPGQQFTVDVDLGAKLALRNPGYYDIIGVFKLSIPDVNDPTEATWDDDIAGIFPIQVQAK